jgi:regulator of vacuolar morphogenesis
MMSHKRKPSSEFRTSYNKRQRPAAADMVDTESSSTPYAIAARIDPTYGQRGAFPGLDDSNGDEELFYGPASDGLEYLRMVR